MKANNLVWIDLEMTGLNPEQDRIIEIATIVTDSNLNIIATGPVMAVHQPDEVLNLMDDWNVKQHNKTGLVTRVKNSEFTESVAEQATLGFLRDFSQKGKSPMCGNSICQDRRFLARYMPELCDFFHYRNLDVSTIKELANRWRPKLMQGFKKKSAHVALDDIIESIDELKFYQSHFFQLTDN
jgi:oligoribonuclease